MLPYMTYCKLFYFVCNIYLTFRKLYRIIRIVKSSIKKSVEGNDFDFHLFCIFGGGMAGLKENMQSNMRKWIGLIAAVFLYYLIHEGCHFAVAMGYGAFEKVRIMVQGVQVVVKKELLTDLQMAIFCAVGSAGTLFTAYMLVFFSVRITKSKNKVMKAVCYYTTLVLLLLDPLYLTIIYQFVGGGDMNGILLLNIPEKAVQLFFGMVTAANGFLIARKIYPLYQQSFRE